SLLDRLLHPGEGLSRALEISGGDPGADEDHQRLPVLRLEVAVGVAVLRFLQRGRLAAEELLLELGEGRGLLLLVVVLQPEAERLAECLLALGVELLVEPLEVLDAGEEPGAREEEIARNLDAVLGAHHVGCADGPERGEELAAELAEGVLVPALQKDEDAGATGRSLAQPLELDDRRLVVREELVEPGAKLQPARQPAARDGEDEPDEQDGPR